MQSSSSEKEVALLERSITILTRMPDHDVNTRTFELMLRGYMMNKRSWHDEWGVANVERCAKLAEAGINTDLSMNSCSIYSIAIAIAVSGFPRAPGRLSLPSILPFFRGRSGSTPLQAEAKDRLHYRLLSP